MSELARKVELLVHESAGIRIEISLRDGRRELAEAGSETALSFSSERTAAAFIARARPLLGGRTGQAVELLAGLPRLAGLEPLTSLFMLPAGANSLTNHRNQDRKTA